MIIPFLSVLAYGDTDLNEIEGINKTWIKKMQNLTNVNQTEVEEIRKDVEKQNKEVIEPINQELNKLYSDYNETEYYIRQSALEVLAEQDQYPIIAFCCPTEEEIRISFQIHNVCEEHLRPLNGTTLNFQNTTQTEMFMNFGKCADGVVKEIKMDAILENQKLQGIQAWHYFLIGIFVAITLFVIGIFYKKFKK